MTQEAELPSSSTSARVAKNTGIYLMVQIVSWITSFVGMAVTARAFPLSSLGKLMVADTVRSTVVMVFALSMEIYIMKEMGRDFRQAPRFVNALLGFRLLMVIPASLCIVLWLALIHADRSLWFFGGIYLASVPVIFFTSMAVGVVSAREDGRRALIAGVLQASLSILSLLVVRFGIEVYLIVSSVGQYLLAGVYFYWLRNFVPVKPSWDVPVWKTMIRGSLPFFLNGIVMQVYGTVTIFTLRHLLDDNAIAVYGQASRLMGTLLFFPTALGTALLPSLSRIVDQSPDQIKRIQARVFSLLIVLGVPTMVMAMGLASPLCAALYGPAKLAKWSAVPSVLQIYAVALIPLYIVSTMYQFLIAKGKNGAWVWFLLMSMLICVGCNFILIPWTQRVWHNGVSGAALSTAIAEACSAVCAIILLGDGVLTRESAGRILRTLAAGGLMAAALYLTRGMFLIVPAGVGIFVYALAGWKLKILEAEEQWKLGQFIAKFLPPRFRRAET